MNTAVPITNLETLFEELDAGVFAQRVATALSDVALATVSQERKTKGKVTVTFDITQIGNSRQVEVSHTLSYVRPTSKGKISEENTTSTPLYVGSRGALTMIPDTQQHLFADRSGEA